MWAQTHHSLSQRNKRNALKTSQKRASRRSIRRLIVRWMSASLVAHNRS